MRKLALFLTPFLMMAVGCCNPSAALRGERDQITDELDSTVQIMVEVSGTLKVKDPITGEDLELPVEAGWVGSGVVYDKSLGLTSPIKSKILTANHVLEAPKPGDVLQGPMGPVTIDAVLMTVRTRSGKTCELTPLVLASSDTEDVATGEADCDAGRVAEIASSVPAVGERVVVTGHPQGVFPSIITEGFVSGWMNGYLMISAGAFGGNSGGPVWHDGKVIGLLVRGSVRYHHISLVVPLKSVHERIAETP